MTLEETKISQLLTAYGVVNNNVTTGNLVQSKSSAGVLAYSILSSLKCVKGDIHIMPDKSNAWGTVQIKIWLNNVCTHHITKTTSATNLVEPIILKDIVFDTIETVAPSDCYISFLGKIFKYA